MKHYYYCEPSNPKFLLNTCKPEQHYFIPLLLKATVYFVNTTTGFLPLLLPDYSVHYISVEKISILIGRYKVASENYHSHAWRNLFVYTLHESIFTYITSYINFLQHPTATGIREIIRMLSPVKSQLYLLCLYICRYNPKLLKEQV